MQVQAPLAPSPIKNHFQNPLSPSSLKITLVAIAALAVISAIAATSFILSMPIILLAAVPVAAFAFAIGILLSKPSEAKSIEKAPIQPQNPQKAEIQQITLRENANQSLHHLRLIAVYLAISACQSDCTESRVDELSKEFAQLPDLSKDVVQKEALMQWKKAIQQFSDLERRARLNLYELKTPQDALVWKHSRTGRKYMELNLVALAHRFAAMSDWENCLEITNSLSDSKFKEELIQRNNERN